MQVKNLYFRRHRQSPYFFQNVSFELEEGLIHALHGKNGVGKSVLLHILSRKIEGEISGEIIAKSVALMDQQFDQALAGQFSFVENLQFGSLRRFPSPFSRLKASSHMMRECFHKLVEKFHIDVSIPVDKLSGGQRQILALLMQLRKDAKVLLLDEPTAALDEQNATMVFEFLQALKGITILVVCHDPDLVNRYTTGKHLRIEVNAEGLRKLQ